MKTEVVSCMPAADGGPGVPIINPEDSGGSC